MGIDFEELAKFLVRAKKQTYAGDGKEVNPQRPGFKELEYTWGDWEYRDSYAGFFSAPGQEVVRLHKNPIWAMSYNGGMRLGYGQDVIFAKRTFAFLKKALSNISPEKPFRGPPFFEDDAYKYFDFNEGDIKDFSGTEHIIYNGREVFRQRYIGGLIVPK